MSSWRVSRAGPPDGARVAELARALLPGAGLPGELVWVARAHAGADAVGYLEAQRAADELHILALAVDPPARRRGAACALLAHVLDWARGVAVRSVYLEVRASNAAARGFYASFGFAVLGGRRRYYADGEDALFLSRALAPAAAAAR